MAMLSDFGTFFVLGGKTPATEGYDREEFSNFLCYFLFFAAFAFWL
jgi:hypothetical protein